MKWRIHVDPTPVGGQHWPARVSVPCPRGLSPAAFTIVGPDGGVAPAQWRPLTLWPDGSPRWVQLDFQATRRGDHVVESLSEARPNPASTRATTLPVESRFDADVWHVRVGRLEVTLSPGEGSPVSAIRWAGQDISQGGFAFIATDAQGKQHALHPGAVAATVEADGPQRFQLSWETNHADDLLAARIRIEVLAGIEGFTLSYQFFHKTPRCPVLALQSIDAEFEFAGLRAGNAALSQTSYGNIGLPRVVRKRQPVTLHLDATRIAPYVRDPAADFDDHVDYPPFLALVNNSAGNAVGLEIDDLCVAFTLRDMECQRPKTLTIEPGRVNVGIWPREAGVLPLPQGRSKRQVFCFRFGAGEGAPKQLETWLGDPRAIYGEPATAWLDKRDSVAAGSTWDQPHLLDGTEPGAAIFSGLLASASARWLTVLEMFNYGDVPDVGYTTGYPGGGRTPSGRKDYVFSTFQMLHPLFHQPQDLPPVWTNNEYDAIYCVALEAIRGRNAQAMKSLRAAARHQIEVDFVHYSDHWQHNRTTPQHSYDHTTLMSAIPSHQWTQGLYYYYALTGDDDVPDVIRGICDFNLSYLQHEELAFMHYFNRELGWAIIALVFGYEVTADERYLQMSRKLLLMLKDKAGEDLAHTGIGVSFAPNTIPIGLKVYHQATAEPWALELLQRWVAYGMTTFNNRATDTKLTELFPETFTYVCRLTGDTRPLEESLWQLDLFFRGVNSIGWLDPHAGALTTKQYTRVYRGLVHLFSAMARAEMLPRLERSLLPATYAQPESETAGRR